jgi:hypothetical protein
MDSMRELHEGAIKGDGNQRDFVGFCMYRALHYGPSVMRPRRYIDWCSLQRMQSKGLETLL